MNLYPHQIEALEQTKFMDKVAYYYDMGLGKTFIGSEKLHSLKEKVNILVCQKSKVKDWMQHFKENYDAVHDIDDYIIPCDLTTPKGILNFIYYCEKSGCQVVGIINYELLWRRGQVSDFLNKNQFTLMLDESSLIQNKSAKQTKAILKLNPKNVILLSGTPTAGKYENLWTQIHLLGWNISEEVYNRQYVNWTSIDVGGYQHKIVDKEEPYKNVDRLKQKLRDNGAVFKKTEEVLDLPEQTFIKSFVPESKEYKKFMKDCIITIDGDELVGDTSLTKRLYARQLCGQYSKYKLAALHDLLESTQDRLIIFYNFNAELIELEAICNDMNRPFSMINGKNKDLQAYEEESNSVTLVQYQAGAMGLNLQKANKIVYFTLPERSELFEQSKKRIHRIGQKEACFYYILMCKGTVEELIYDTLEQRKDFTDELFKENF